MIENRIKKNPLNRTIKQIAEFKIIARCGTNLTYKLRSGVIFQDKKVRFTQNMKILDNKKAIQYNAGATIMLVSVSIETFSHSNSEKKSPEIEFQH